MAPDPREVVDALQRHVEARRLGLGEILEQLPGLAAEGGAATEPLAWPDGVVARLAALLRLAESRAAESATGPAATAATPSPTADAPSRLRALLIGFGAEDAAKLCATLEATGDTEFLVRVAGDFEAVPALLECDAFDVAVLDLTRQRGGTAILSRAEVVTGGLPLVGVAASAAEAEALRDAGCGALVSEDLCAQTASRALCDAYLEHELESTLAGSEKEPYFSTRDALTGLPNRSSFRAQLDIAIHYAQRHEEQVSVLFVDVDRGGVKASRLGADIEDGLIITLAERMERVARKSDLIARIGDDEFALMLQGRDLDFAPARTAERLHECLSQVFVVGDRKLSMAASIGIATFPRDAADADTLIRNAASAAHEARAEGQDSYRFYGQAMSVLEARKMEVAHQLRGALQRNQFRLQYQPRVDGGSGEVLGAEALLRWNDRELGTVSPAEFVPIAERMGLMADIGAWVMQEACQAHQAWAATGFDSLRLSVNVSAHQVESASLRDAVVMSLVNAGISPGLLEIELTESALVDNEARAATLLREFAEVGVSLALDDFGTGYSSLAYLRQFPVSTLKIDPSFVRAIRPGAPFPPFVAAILSLASSLDLEVVAEGVETEVQRDALLERGCRQMQGFLFSRPLVHDDFVALLVSGGVVAAGADNSAR